MPVHRYSWADEMTLGAIPAHASPPGHRSHDVEISWTPALATHPARSALELLRPPQPLPRFAGRIVGDQHRIEELPLLHPTPGVGLIYRGSRNQRIAETVGDRPQSCQAVTQVGANREHYPRHTAPPAGTTQPRPPRRERRITTATSSNVCGMGACGLCTATSTACTRWSSIT